MDADGGSSQPNAASTTPSKTPTTSSVAVIGSPAADRSILESWVSGEVTEADVVAARRRQEQQNLAQPETSDAAAAASSIADDHVPEEKCIDGATADCLLESAQTAEDTNPFADTVADEKDDVLNIISAQCEQQTEAAVNRDLFGSHLVDGDVYIKMAEEKLECTSAEHEPGDIATSSKTVEIEATTSASAVGGEGMNVISAQLATACVGSVRPSSTFKPKHVRELQGLAFTNPGPSIGRHSDEESLMYLERRVRRPPKKFVASIAPSRESSSTNEEDEEECVSHDSRGVLTIGSRCIDLCDCLVPNCPGCWYACPKCGSAKCGTSCRQKRRSYVAGWVDHNVQEKSAMREMKNKMVQEYLASRANKPRQKGRGGK